MLLNIRIKQNNRKQTNNSKILGIDCPAVQLRYEPGYERLFQKGGNHFVLMHKNGTAVAFQLDHNGKVHVVDRQTDVSFTSTGLSLIDDGWKCIGPGLEYSWLFE